MDLMLLRTFQRQVQLQCEIVILSAQDLERALRVQSSAEAWAAIQSLLTAAANVSKALWGAGGRFATQREPLRASLGVDNDSPLKVVAMRNHFEHYDERLDVWWRTSANHNIVDQIIGPRGVLVVGLDETDMFRQFDPTTAELVFWGEEFNLREIVEEVERLLPIVAAEAEKPHWEPPPSTLGNGQ